MRKSKLVCELNVVYRKCVAGAKSLTMPLPFPMQPSKKLGPDILPFILLSPKPSAVGCNNNALFILCRPYQNGCQTCGSIDHCSKEDQICVTKPAQITAIEMIILMYDKHHNLIE